MSVLADGAVVHLRGEECPVSDGQPLIVPDIRGWTNDGFQEITAEQWCDSRREYRSETHAIMP